LGSTAAYLTTGSANVIAVQLYLGLGFQPHVLSEAELAAWEGLRGCVAPRFAALLTGLTRNRRHDSP